MKPLMNVEDFHKALISWGKTNFREYPWRLTNNPYEILIAELMLHRTQASQVVKVYEQFIARYPTPQRLLKATEEEIESSLHSLGLLWRIRLIHKLAQVIVTTYEGRVPVEKEKLILLPGISDYIASAVRCFAWNLPEAIVDTNTVRVVGRLLGLETKDSSRRNQQVRKLIRDLVDEDAPRDYNFAILDLADGICLAKRQPLHAICPVLSYCRYGNLHGQHEAGDQRIREIAPKVVRNEEQIPRQSVAGEHIYLISMVREESSSISLTHPIVHIRRQTKKHGRMIQAR